jgi:hypothetical protein
VWAAEPVKHTGLSQQREAVWHSPVLDDPAVDHPGDLDDITPGVYRELVEASHWTSEQFEEWVGDALALHLLGST